MQPIPPNTLHLLSDWRRISHNGVANQWVIGSIKSREIQLCVSLYHTISFELIGLLFWSVGMVTYIAAHSRIRISFLVFANPKNELLQL